MTYNYCGVWTYSGFEIDKYLGFIKHTLRFVTFVNIYIHLCEDTKKNSKCHLGVGTTLELDKHKNPNIIKPGLEFSTQYEIVVQSLLPFWVTHHRVWCCLVSWMYRHNPTVCHANFCKPQNLHLLTTSLMSALVQESNKARQVNNEP